MGYSTDFYGSFELSRPATEQEKDYINRIASTRRMKRDVNKLMEVYKGEYGNPFAKEQTPEAIYGYYGEYFAFDGVGYSEYDDKTIIDLNTAPGESEFLSGSKNGEHQPGLWCQWELNDEGTRLEWDGGEKFYNYVEWLQYLIKHFFEPWGIKINGEVEWQGDDPNDFGKLIVINNLVAIKIGRKIYE